MIDKEIREAVEYFSPIYLMKYPPEKQQKIKTLMEVAKLYLSAGEGLPEEKDDYSCDKSDGYMTGVNETLRQCKAAVAKNYIHRSKLLTEDEIGFEIYKNYAMNPRIKADEHALNQWTAKYYNLPHKDKASICAKAILNRQEEKISSGR